MLLFEFFPAFVAVVSIVIGVGLYAINRRTTQAGEPETPRAPSQPAVTAGTAERSSGPRRPSMSA